MAQPAASSSHFNDSPKYHAPEANAQALIQPSLALALREQVGFASRPSSRSGVRIGPHQLRELREVARRDAIQAAIEYTGSYRQLWFDPVQYAQRAIDAPWLVAGHQPELFHPGVWFKNFLLSQASQQTTCVALNLVIDNDLCRSPAIRVPAIDVRESGSLVRTESVPFDAPSPPVAWECRSILDRELLRSFADRVQQSLPSGLANPLVDRLWPHAIAAAERTGLLGLTLAQARHAFEGELGLRTLELPLSMLVQQSSFAKFSLAILADIARFQEVYNAQRAAYRRANAIRSQSHPVPALQTRNGWFEAPWWGYRQTEPTRRRLFVRLEGDDLMLSDQAGWQTVIEGPLDGDDAVADWMQLAIDGVLLRPRALITTMFARLVISDLFMHGIGGGKYDQMTDAIIRDYFDIPAPPMVVATATMRLPLADQLQLGSVQQNVNALQEASSDAWHMRYHPEQHIDSPSAETDSLLQRKRELLDAIPPRGEKWEWHHEITRVNQRLAQLNVGSFERSQQRLQELALQTRQLKLATSREFSFCLFEQNYVAGALQQLASSEFDLPAAK